MLKILIHPDKKPAKKKPKKQKNSQQEVEIMFHINSLMWQLSIGGNLKQSGIFDNINVKCWLQININKLIVKLKFNRSEF